MKQLDDCKSNGKSALGGAAHFQIHSEAPDQEQVEGNEVVTGNCDANASALDRSRSMGDNSPTGHDC